jgi:hypothetical protein
VIRVLPIMGIVPININNRHKEPTDRKKINKPATTSFKATLDICMYDRAESIEQWEK